MKGLLRLCAVAALVLTNDSRARAEHVHFDYVWHSGPLAAGKPGGVRVWTGPVPAILYNGSAQLGAAPVPLDEVAPLLVETPPGAAPLTLDDPFSLTYSFSKGDELYGRLTVAGRLRGTLGPGSSTLTLTFSGPGSAQLGGHLYQVWIDPVSVPPAPEWGGVVLRPRLAVSEATHAPEPSALALAAAAGLTLAAFRRFRPPDGPRRARRPSASP